MKPTKKDAPLVETLVPPGKYDDLQDYFEALQESIREATQFIDAVKTADEDRASTVIAASDDDLRFDNLDKDTSYALDGLIIVHSASATPDFQWTWLVESGTLTNSFVATLSVEDAAGFAAHLSRSDSFSATPVQALTAGVHQLLWMRGHFQHNQGGRLYFQWSQNVSNATPTTIREGSWLRLRKL